MRLLSGAVLAGVVLAGLLAACSGPGGGERAATDGASAEGAAADAPPDGARLAEQTYIDVMSARRQAGLPPVPHDPALDEKARTGLRIIEAGLPEGVSAVSHIGKVAELPVGLSYGVGFEEDTPGLDDAARQVKQRGGYTLSNTMLAGDPALDGIGWAGGGPWAVLVLRSRLLGPADAAPLQKALEASIEKYRPALRPDPALAGLAAEAVANGGISYEDVESFGRAGGVPVHLEYVESDNFRPTAFLNSRLDGEGPGALRESWLDRVGVGTKITEGGNVLYVVLAAGVTDRAALLAQIEAAEPKATDLVNRERAELRLPSLRRDARLVAAAKLSLAEAVKRSCFNSDDRCYPDIPDAVELYAEQRTTWFSAEDAYTWDLGAEDGAEIYRRFGVAATLGPDGTVWSVLLLAA